MEDCKFEGDELATTKHFGVLVSGRLVTIASVYEVMNDGLMANKSYQLRGMACDPNFRGRGLARELLHAVELFTQEQNADLLWFNARLSAKSFYNELEFAIKGDEFDIPTVGPHVVMYKYLNK